MAQKTSAEMIQMAQDTLSEFSGIVHSGFSDRIAEIKQLPDSDEKNAALNNLLQSMSDALASQYLMEADQCGPRKD